MTINDWEAFKAGVWDWGILDGCFGQTRIAPTDIDGLVERNGKFLVIEAKGLTTDLKLGQRITLEALWRTGLFTIIIIWGETDKPQRLELWNEQGKSDPYDADLDELRRVVTEWFIRVNGSVVNTDSYSDLI